MKFIRQDVDGRTGAVRDHYEKAWRGHKVRVELKYEFDTESVWDGDEPLPEHYECYGVTATVRFGGQEAGNSVWNSWIDPVTEGRHGTNYLFETAKDLMEESLHELAGKLAASGHTCRSKACIVQGVLET